MRGHYRKSPVGSKHKNESKKLKRGRMKRAVGMEGQGEQGMIREVRMKEKHMARWKKEKIDFNIISSKMSNREITANIKKK